MRFSVVALCALVGTAVSAGSLASEASNVVSGFDPGFTAANEQYLAPYLDELAIYSQYQPGKELIDLAKLVDVLPAWLEDLLVPIFLPGDTLTLPLDVEIPIKIPVGSIKIPLPAKFTLSSVTVNDLNKFKELKPAKFLNGNFTWGGDVQLKETTVGMTAKLVVLGHDVDVNVSVLLVTPSLHFETIAAFNRTRICEVWGKVMQSSASCAVWPMMLRQDQGISGLNVTSLRVNITDFTFNMTVSGLGPLNKDLQTELTKIVNDQKPDIIASLPSLDQKLAGIATSGVVGALPGLQKGCDPPVLRPTDVLSDDLNVLNVSKVCVSNNAGFVLKWQYQNCPARAASDETPGFDIDQSRCMDIGEALPQTQTADAMRVRVHAVAGLHDLVDPAIRFVPNSSAASFECSGTTLDYHCDLVSVVPLDPTVLPPVSKICIINHAGFVMEFSTENTRTGSSKTSSRYPIDKTECIEPTSVDGTQDGDEFKVHVHAILGKSQDTNRAVRYANNSLTATYECRGTTLDYSCNLLGS